MERVTITATFDLSDGSCAWRDPAETAETFRHMIEEELLDFNINNVKVVSKHEIVPEQQKDIGANCGHYHFEGGLPVCWGTKETEQCLCRGWKKLCDFYQFDENGNYVGLK